jgi:hypothetical protein
MDGKMPLVGDLTNGRNPFTMRIIPLRPVEAGISAMQESPEASNKYPFPRYSQRGHRKSM